MRPSIKIIPNKEVGSGVVITVIDEMYCVTIPVEVRDSRGGIMLTGACVCPFSDEEDAKLAAIVLSTDLLVFGEGGLMDGAPNGRE